jgi:prophage antirepressor-like protein
MNELARLVTFYLGPLGFDQSYRIVDREGNPWFVVMDIAAILEIKDYRHTIGTFPENWKSYVVCDVYSIHGTSAKSRARKTQKVLIINEAGLLRFITRSNKPIARQLQDKIFEEVLPAYRKHGINWAALPKVWNYRGQMLNYAEWRAKKEEWYFKRFPDADYDDFLRSLPRYPPEYPPKKQAPEDTTRPPEAPQEAKPAQDTEKGENPGIGPNPKNGETG